MQFNPSRKFRCAQPVSENGFTFLEIMIALAILGGLIVTVLTTLSYHAGMVKRNRDITFAAILAREKLEEMMISGIPADGDGDLVHEVKGGFRWKYNAYRTVYQGIKRISVTVSWGRHDNLTMEAYGAVGKSSLGE